MAGAMCLSCASTSEGIAMMQPEVPPGAGPIHVGRARVVDARVNPTLGVHVAVDGDAIVVRFARPHQEAEARLDSISLDVRSVTTEGVRVDRNSVDSRPDRVTLDGDTFIVCSNRRGNPESPNRAVVQAFDVTDGLPGGAPVVISPPDVNVIGTPQAVKIDNHRAVVTFEADTGGSFALFAVPVESL
jgi:hypothetical protein